VIIGRGAEAIIRREGRKVVKERVSKGYRVPELDSKLIKSRTRSEAKLMKKISEAINVPEILEFTEKDIVMSFISGDKLSEHLDNYPEAKRKKICKAIGEQVAIMHDSDVIHGDLTTSNMILHNDEVFFIDFGLGFVNQHVEHKAVDLHLIRQALESKHHSHFEESFAELIKGYRKSRNFEAVMDRLEKVSSRGRYKKRK
jgi:Kae1-associated kinase Bud32